MLIYFNSSYVVIHSNWFKLAYSRSIYDSEDSFPTGAIRKKGRVFMRPDLVNLQKLDGVLFNIKYLIILRNITVILKFFIV
jgi:hypothetical protein